LGQHTKEILKALGYSDEEVEGFRWPPSFRKRWSRL